MIDPKNITKYDRSNAELQEFLLFSIAVAGKNAASTATALDRFLRSMPTNPAWCSPFVRVRLYFAKKPASLPGLLKECGFGCYRQRAKAFLGAANAGLDLRHCTVEDLEKLYGVGPKTARFFLLHSRPGQRVAVLDRHVLKWLADAGFKNVPTATPTGKRYKALEQLFLNLVPPGKTVAEFDLELWKAATETLKP